MNRIAISLLLIILSAALFGVRANAQTQPTTYTTTSCNEYTNATGDNGTFDSPDPGSVMGTIATEQASPVDGDVIKIPAGTCTWDTPYSVAFGNSVTIQGAGAESSTAGGASTTGTDQTIIYDGVDHNERRLPPIISITTTTGKSFRLTGIAFLQTSSSINAAGNGLVRIQGSSSSVRVDHCHFYSHYSGNKDLQLNGNVLGVADHDFFDANPGIVTFDLAFYDGANWNGASGPAHGNASWTDGDHWGTNKFFFAEDDFFKYGDASDCADGARYVIRYSTGFGSKVASHGLSGGVQRGCRATEFYHNNFTYSNPTGLNYYSTLLPLNSGTALAWDNNTTGYVHVTSFGLVRTSNITYVQQPVPDGWGYCGGAPYTKGSAAVASGSTSVTGTNFSTAWPSGSMIIIPGASCTVNSRTGDTCEILRVETSTTLTLVSPAGASVNGVTYTVGSPWDGNSKTDGYPCLDGPARGAGELLTGSGFPFPTIKNSITGTQSWPHQVLDPIYVWGNTYNPVGTNHDSIVDDGTGMLTENVDYYQQFGKYGEPGIFDGKKGVGQGLLSARPATCTAGVAYWATDQDALYICGATGWPSTPSYTPYTYPYPTSNTSTSPQNLRVTRIK